MQVLIAGDLVPTQSNIELFNKADIKSLLGDELLSLWNSANIRIFNLETPLTDKKNPILKCGPNLIAPMSTVKGIKALNPSLITLANNHILDQGEQGLTFTRKCLIDSNIPYIGAGDNLLEASKAYIFHNNGMKIGVYACAETEFSIASETKVGANPFDPLESFTHLRKLKLECDYLIVVYHGGVEEYRYPSPYLQKVCRKMVTEGANLVLCQHSHCIGCKEIYMNSEIVYGQGNFVFDRKHNKYWDTGMIIEIDMNNNNTSIRYHPIKTKNSGVNLVKEIDKETIMNEFNYRSRCIVDSEFVDEEYSKLAVKKVNGYIATIMGYNIFVRALMKYGHRLLYKTVYTKKSLLMILNYISCESHRELFIAGIKEKIKSDN